MTQEIIEVIYYKFKNMFSESNMKNVYGVGAILTCLIVLIGICSSWTVVSPGCAGVIFNKLSGALSTRGQGLAFKIPFVTNVQSYPVSLRTYSMVMQSREDDSLDLPTKEGQHIKQDLSITYNTSPERAADVFKAFKGADIEDIENTFIRRTAITVAQNISGSMSLSELISSDRTKLQNDIQASLATELAKMGFNLDKVNLGASHLPEAIEAQMQQKMAAQQEAQKAEYELQKQTMLAKAAVAQAQGTAQSLLVQAKAQSEANELLNKTLTPMLIENKKIEQWDGVLPKVTGGVTPLINLNK